MNIQKDIATLLNAGVINEEVAESINAYYKNNEGRSSGRMMVIFGVLGAILIGLGIILMIAHNWDDLSKITKTVLSFAPLLIGQISCIYVLLKKFDSEAWRESASGFLFLSVGSCIALISQIYHISGDLSTFLLTWLLLGLPITYIMRSSVSSLFYIAGITWFAVESNSFWGNDNHSNLYWLLLLGVIPHYWILLKNNTLSNYTIIHNWLIPLSLTISLGFHSHHSNHFIYLAYMSMFGIFFQVSQFSCFSSERRIKNGYRFLGTVGTIFILIVLSFSEPWNLYNYENINDKQPTVLPEHVFSIVLSAIGLAVFLYQQKKKITSNDVFSYAFLFFIPIFFLGQFSTVAAIFDNFLSLFIGVMTIRKGTQENHLGILNFGLLIIAVLTICRFFDQDLSFLIRGALFILVGMGFFIANYQLIKKRKNND